MLLRHLLFLVSNILLILQNINGIPLHVISLGSHNIVGLKWEFRRRLIPIIYCMARLRSLWPTSSPRSSDISGDTSRFRQLLIISPSWGWVSLTNRVSSNSSERFSNLLWAKSLWNNWNERGELRRFPRRWIHTNSVSSQEHFQREQLYLEDDVESHLTQINLNLCEWLVTVLVWTREFYKAFLILTPDYWM